MTTMLSKFSGTCVRCKRRFGAGTAIQWERGVGAMHADPAACAVALSTPPPPPPATWLGGTAIFAFLIAAKARGLRHPKARFLAPGGGELRLSLSGPASKVPGSLQVVVGEDWRGRVEPDGSVQGPLATDLALQDALVIIATDPAQAAHDYGALMCRCSFCGLALTDAGSVEVGYGPTCAKKWGLPHSPRGTPAVQAVA